MTPMVRLAVVAPAGFLAVTVYAAGAVPAVGVPVMAPVVLLSVKPAGKAGETVKLSTTPVTVAIFGAIATLFPYVAGFEEYARPDGGPLTTMVRLTVVAPARFFAVTVYAAEAVAVVGVPVIVPVVLLSVKPAGKAGDTVKLSTAPETVARFGVIATPCQYVAGFDEYQRPDVEPLTVITMLAVAFPAGFLAVMV